MAERSKRSQDGAALYRRAKELIPGGTQLLSKRPEMFLPDQWPAYYDRCKGVYTWGLDGRRYIDMTIHGVGSCILGFADPDVDRAVLKAVRQGTMCTLNCAEEVELAELLCQLHPWADKARFARGGGEAMSMAIRIARAATGRDQVAFCGYHGWHDWYLSANLANDRNLDGQLLPGLDPHGVPRMLAGSADPFHYGKKEELDRIIETHGNKLAAIIIEPARGADPDAAFLQHARDAANRLGAVLIFDEVTSGWRQTVGGIHLKTPVVPDMAVFAKGMSNGYPMAAIIGIGSVMDAAQKTFVSSTYWTERIGPVAAIATIRKLKRLNAPKHLNKIGKRVQDGWRRSAQKHGLDLKVSGIFPLSHFAFGGTEHREMRTFFTQHLLSKGYLASGSFYVSMAHTETLVQRYLKTVDESFKLIRAGLDRGTLKSDLKGPVAHEGFSRLT